MLIAIGSLQPSDHVPGCTYTIEQISSKAEDLLYRVTLKSPYNPNDVVDSDTMKEEQVFPWLRHRRNY